MTGLGNISTLVTTDIPGEPAAFFIDTGTAPPSFDREKLADSKITKHVTRAIDTAWDTFKECKVLAVLEDDLQLSFDFYNVLQSYAPLMIEHNYCFRGVNMVGFTEYGPWSIHRSRLVTHGLFYGFALTRPIWRDIRSLAMIRHWDNLINAIYNFTCIVPEVSRVRHRHKRGATHRTPRFEEEIELYDHRGYLPPMEPPIRPPSQVPLTKPCPPKIESLQKSGYNGVVYGPAERRTRVFPCRYRKPLYGEKPAQMPLLPTGWTMAPLGTSCDVHCNNRCHREAFENVGNQGLLFRLKMLGGCNQTALEIGRDLPAVIVERGAATCVVGSNSGLYTCSGSHPKTRRLCPCLNLNAIEQPAAADYTEVHQKASSESSSLLTWAFALTLVYVCRRALGRGARGAIYASRKQMTGIRYRTIIPKHR